MGVTVEGIDGAIRQITDVTEGAIAGTIIEVTGLVASRTPVDTGFARNSWYATLDGNDAGTPGQNDPTASALDAANSYDLGGVAYIVNGAAYIGRLEEGHSQQAPGGMVARTLPEVPDILAEQMRDIQRSGR